MMSQSFLIFPFVMWEGSIKNPIFSVGFSKQILTYAYDIDGKYNKEVFIRQNNCLTIVSDSEVGFLLSSRVPDFRFVSCCKHASLVN